MGDKNVRMQLTESLLMADPCREKDVLNVHQQAVIVLALRMPD